MAQAEFTWKSLLLGSLTARLAYSWALHASLVSGLAVEVRWFLARRRVTGQLDVDRIDD
jgi:hypothetical protein